MLSKINRLSSNREFQNIYRKGRSNTSPYFSVTVLPNRLGINRFGIVVSKKVAKKAVDRNRIKRQSREIIANLNKNVRNKQYDIIVSVRNNALNAKYDTLKSDLETLLQKSNAI